ISDQSMPPTQDKLTLTLSASDTDNDAIGFSARVADPDAQLLARQLDQQFGLSYMGSYYTNFQGNAEKWLQGNDAQYFILPNGEFRYWQNATYSYGPSGLIWTFDPSFYADPSKLWNAAAPPVVSVSGNQLTIDPAAGFTGGFMVETTANDGYAPDTAFFFVNVAGTAVSASAVRD